MEYHQPDQTMGFGGGQEAVMEEEDSPPPMHQPVDNDDRLNDDTNFVQEDEEDDEDAGGGGAVVGDGGGGGDGGGRTRRAGPKKRYRQAADEFDDEDDEDEGEDDGGDYQAAKPRAWSKPWSKSFVGRKCDKCGEEAVKHARRCVCGEKLTTRGSAKEAWKPPVKKRRGAAATGGRKAKVVFGGDPEMDECGHPVVEVILGRRLRPEFASKAEEAANLGNFAFEYQVKWRQHSRLKLDWLSFEQVERLGKKSRGTFQRWVQKIREGEDEESAGVLLCEVERIVDQRENTVFELEEEKQEEEKQHEEKKQEVIIEDAAAAAAAADKEEEEEAQPSRRMIMELDSTFMDEERSAKGAAWRSDGDHVGSWITRSSINDDGPPAFSVGRVLGWLDSHESDFVDDRNYRAPLWRARFFAGPLKGDVEDLETHEVQESAPRPHPNDTEAEAEWHAYAAERDARSGLKSPLVKLSPELRRIRKVILHVSTDQSAWPFMERVEMIEGYVETIYPNPPKDLATIVEDLDKGVMYPSTDKLHLDLKIVWQNCALYNGLQSEIALVAEGLAMRFERLCATWTPTAPRLADDDEEEVDECVHCDGVQDLRTDANGVRRCRRCEYKGGRGLLAFARAEEAAFERSLTASKRKKEVRRTEYLVKWRGDSYETCTWESSKELGTFATKQIGRFNDLKRWIYGMRPKEEIYMSDDDEEQRRQQQQQQQLLEQQPPKKLAGTFFTITVAHAEFSRISFDVRAVGTAYYIVVIGTQQPPPKEADNNNNNNNNGDHTNVAAPASQMMIRDEISKLRWGDVVYELGNSPLFGLALDALRARLGMLHEQARTLAMTVVRPIGHAGNVEGVLKKARAAVEHRESAQERHSQKKKHRLEIVEKYPRIEKPRAARGDDRVLRPYQEHGVSWLVANRAERRGCILADEMGLGKTAQVAMALERDYVDGGPPSLVVAPLSTIEQWRRELESWTSLSVCLYHGVSAKGSSRDLVREFEWWPLRMNPKRGMVAFDVLVTTYEIIQQDASALRGVSWGCVVVDEAHRLKRDGSRLAESLEKAISLTGEDCWRLLITGTPLQNNLKEMWSLLHFADPKHFGSYKQFEKEFGAIESAGDVAQLGALKETLKPRLLRRVKEDVAKDIPEKKETIIDVELTLLQKRLYRAIYERNAAALQTASCSSAALRSVQMQLRNACNHASLVQGLEDPQGLGFGTGMDAEQDALVRGSGKFVLLEKLLPRLKSEGRRVLIFSQFVRLLDLLAKFCNLRNHNFERIDGTIKMSDRQISIDKFNDPNSDCFLFLISTRAGGVGLNLQAADTVIIYDSDWNPQNDLQAQARCHRLGQKKEVMVYRFVAARSFERTMFDRASRKLGLERAVLGAPGQAQDAEKQPSKKALQDLLKLGAFQLLSDDKDTEVAVSKKFDEADIDSILSERSSTRIVAATANDKDTFDGKINVTATSFGAGGGGISLDDPEFWTKLCSAMTQDEKQQREEETRASRAKQQPINIAKKKKKKEVVVVESEDEGNNDEADAALKDLKFRADGVLLKKEAGERHYHRELQRVLTSAQRMANDDDLDHSRREKAAAIRDSLMPSKDHLDRSSRRTRKEEPLYTPIIPLKKKDPEDKASSLAATEEEETSSRRRRTWRAVAPHRAHFNAFVQAACEYDDTADRKAAQNAANSAISAERYRAAVDRFQAENAVRAAMTAEACREAAVQRRVMIEEEHERQEQIRMHRHLEQQRRSAAGDPMPKVKKKSKSQRRPTVDQSSSSSAMEEEVAEEATSSNQQPHFHRWTQAEDALVLRLVAPQADESSVEWKMVATELSQASGRSMSARQIRERWRNHLDPTLSNAAWSREEDSVLIVEFASRGKRWSEIAKRLPGRSEMKVKQRFSTFSSFVEAFLQADHPRNLELLRDHKDQESIDAILEDAYAQEQVTEARQHQALVKKQHRETKRVEAPPKWRNNGHEDIGAYVLIERPQPAILKVEAWTQSDAPLFSCEYVLGSKLGESVSLTETEVHEGKPTFALQSHLEVLGLQTVKRMRYYEDGDIAQALEMLAIDEAILATPPEWRAAYGCVVYATHLAKEPAWPSLILDPRSFQSDPKLRARALRKLGTEHVVRFFGMPAARSIGFVSKNSMTPFDARLAITEDVLLKQYSKKTAKSYLEGVMSATRSVPIAAPTQAAATSQRPRRDPPAVGSEILLRWEGDSHEYRCRVHQCAISGALLVSSEEFEPDEPESIPFDPTEDDWRLAHTPENNHQSSEEEEDEDDEENYNSMAAL